MFSIEQIAITARSNKVEFQNFKEIFANLDDNEAINPSVTARAKETLLAVKRPLAIRCVKLSAERNDYKNTFETKPEP